MYGKLDVFVGWQDISRGWEQKAGGRKCAIQGLMLPAKWVSVQGESCTIQLGRWIRWEPMAELHADFHPTDGVDTALVPFGLIDSRSDRLNKNAVTCRRVSKPARQAPCEY